MSLWTTREGTVNTVNNSANETLVHRSFGHLSERSLHKLAKGDLVSSLSYNTSTEIKFCVAYDPKAKRCIFLRYAAQRKRYRLYDITTPSIVFSRHVVFNNLQLESKGSKKKSASFLEEEQEQEENFEQNGITDENQTKDRQEEETPVVAQVPQGKSFPEVRHPDYYCVQVYVATELQKEPESVEVLFFTKKERWKAALQTEMESIYSNDVRDLVEPPKECKPAGSKWVFKCKINVDGSAERYKAPLVAQGFSQWSGGDYDEFFSIVIRFKSVRTLIALTVQKIWVSFNPQVIYAFT